MHPPGVFQLLVLALIVMVLFGRGRISEFMGDVGKGVKTFRKGLADDGEPAPSVAIDGPVGEATIDSQPSDPTQD